MDKYHIQRYKFSENGSTVPVKLESTEHHHKIYISDEGIGMTEEQIRHIFDKFYQADSSRQSQGNGLGLALCKEILDKCGGKIFVTSKQGAGSVFLILYQIYYGRTSVKCVLPYP